MKPSVFAYHRATTVDEAVSALQQYGGGARVLAGGQSLVPMLNMRLWKPDALVDIADIDELDRVEATGRGLSLGAMVRYSTIERSELIARHAPLLPQVVLHIGDRQVRNRGTIGGALVHADPTGELALACLALDAVVVVAGESGVRRVPVRELYTGSYATVLEPVEMVVAVEVPPSPRFHAFGEICRKHNDFALVSVAVLGDLGEDGTWSDVRLALGGVNDTVVRAAEAERLLEGSRLTDEVIDEAASAVLAVIDPPGDIRASAEYRSHLTPVQVRRSLTQLRQAGADASLEKGSR